MMSLAALLPASALTRYDDHGEPLLTARERLLIAMRRLDWATSTEIFEALQGESRSRWHANEHQALCRLVKAGLVLARGAYGCREYKLNEAAFTQVPLAPLDRRSCTQCKRPALRNRTLCERHLDYQAAYQRKRYAQRKAA